MSYFKVQFDLKLENRSSRRRCKAPGSGPGRHLRKRRAKSDPFGSTRVGRMRAKLLLRA